MNYLFISGHPAHVHNFRLVREELLKDGHKVFWMTTNKDICLQLLELYKIPYVLLSKPGKSFLNRVSSIIKNSLIIIHYIGINKIDIVISRTNPYGSIACLLTRKPHVTLSDTEHAYKNSFMKFFAKVCSAALVPECFYCKIKKNQIYFAGNIELFYLHKNRFVPQKLHQLLGINNDTRYAIIRFVKWDAFHDVNLAGGFSIDHKVNLVEGLSKYVKVFISSEDTLPDSLEKYRIHIPLSKMHDVLAGASLIVGESATMSSESVVLGTPAVYIDEVGRGYTDEEAKEGLLYMFRPNEQEEAISKAIEIVSPSFDKAAFEVKYAAFLEKKIDPTAWLVWFLEKYPESKIVMLKTPEYQYYFK